VWVSGSSFQSSFYPTDRYRTGGAASFPACGKF
jgi:hypothetical protein